MKNQHTLELDDGRIVAEFCAETFELLGLEDWHGNEPHHRWERIAQDRLDDMNFEKEQASK